MSVLASPMLTTSRPWAVTPSAKAATSSGDDGRMSWPTTTTPVSAPGLTDGLGQRREVVDAVLRRGELALEADDLTAARCGEPVGVLVAQVVGVRLGLGGERSDDGRGIGVDISERGHRE